MLKWSGTGVEGGPVLGEAEGEAESVCLGLGSVGAGWGKQGG